MKTKLKLRQPCFSASNPGVQYVRRLNGSVEVYQGKTTKGQPFMHPDLVKLGTEMSRDYPRLLAEARGLF